MKGRAWAQVTKSCGEHARRSRSPLTSTRVSCCTGWHSPRELGVPSGPTTQSHADDEDPAALQVRGLRALNVAEDPLDVGAPAVGLDPGVRAPGQRLADLRHDGTRDGDGVLAASGSARRHHHVTPPMTKSSFDGLADPGSIFLELGQSGGAHPADPASVQSLLSRALQSANDVAEFDDLRPFTVSVLHPGRTLIEKLLRMNNFSQASDSERDAKGWPRIGRQFYDVWALLGHSSVVGFLQDTKAVRAVLADCAVVPQSFGQNAPPPADGCAASGVFTGVGVDMARLESASSATCLRRQPEQTAPSPLRPGPGRSPLGVLRPAPEVQRSGAPRPTRGAARRRSAPDGVRARRIGVGSRRKDRSTTPR